MPPPFMSPLSVRDMPNSPMSRATISRCHRGASGLLSSCSADGRDTVTVLSFDESRIERLHRPAVARPRIEVSLVQPARLAFPEFDVVRLQSESRPERGTRHCPALEFLFVPRDALREIVRPFNRLTLNRCPRTNLAVAGPGGEVFVRFRVGYLGRLALGPNLHAERRPVKAD